MMHALFRRCCYLHQHGFRHHHHPHHHHHHQHAVAAGGRRSFYYSKTTTATTTPSSSSFFSDTSSSSSKISSSSSSSSLQQRNYHDDYFHDLKRSQHQHQQRRWLGTSSNNNKNNRKKKSQAMKRQTQKQQQQRQTPSTTTTTTTTASTDAAVSSSSSSSSPSSSFTVANEEETTTATTTTKSDTTMSTEFSSTTNNKKQQQHFKLPSNITLDWESNKRSELLSSLSTTSDTRLDQTLKSSMYDPNIHLPYAPKQWTSSEYEPATDLSDEIMERIGVSGKPITVAEYIRNALTHPLYGYYTSQTTLTKTKGSADDDDWDDKYNDDYSDTQPTTTTTKTSTTTSSSSSKSSKIFGRTGDFITAPEISHVFGHCICVWFMTQYDTILGKPSQLQLVELGPGRGTLIADILQLALTSSATRDDGKSSDFGNSIIQVNLIETSFELRQQQQITISESLKDLDVELEFVNNNSNNSINDHKEEVRETTSASKSTSNKTNNNKNNQNKNKDQKIIKIVWYNDFTEFQHHRNKKLPILLIAQEFFDALPIHVFQMTTNGWREQLIDVVEVNTEANTEAKATEATEATDSSNEGQDQENDNDSATAVSSKNNNNESSSKMKKKPIPRLRQVLAPDVTPAVEVLLSGSEYNNQANFPIDSVVEICPEAICLIKDIAQVLEESHGTALIIDYGEDGTSDTLRAFSKHKQVPLTSMPGQVDVTADVDFFALRKSLGASASDAETTDTTTNIINAFGPVTQGEFLMSMGASDMVIHKIEQDETTEEQAQRIYDALQFLVMPEHMGQRYKVLALGRKRDGIFAPPGF